MLPSETYNLRHAAALLLVVLCSVIFFQCTSNPPAPTDVLVNPIDPKSPVFIKPATTIVSAPNSSTILTVPQATITVQGNADAVAFSYKLNANEWSPWNASPTILLLDLDEGLNHCSIRALHRDNMTVEENPPTVDFTVNAVTGPALMFASRRKETTFANTFNYYIVAEEVQNVFGAKVTFSYDNSAIRINTITAGAVSTGTVQLLEKRYGNKASVEMFFINTSPMNGITGSDTIAVINCSPLKTGETLFTFVSDSLQLRTTTNTTIPINQVVNGKVVVK